MNAHILLIIPIIYFIGFCIAVFLFKKDIGKKTENLFGDSYTATYIDICLNAMCWPLWFFIITLIGPWLLLTKVILKLTKK